MQELDYDINIADAPPDAGYFEAEVREGFFISSMMKRYWASELRVLSEIDRVCKRHGIRWFADCGTLLGAVRHGGFIPWDDDLDICMLRHDWIRFFEVAKEELPKDYCVLNLQLEKEYEQVIGRIVNAHAIDFGEAHMKEFFGCPYTIGIDIFPLDGLAEEEEEEEKRRALAQDAGRAYELVNAGNTKSPECRKLLADIERQNHITLHRDGNLLRELRLLSEKLYRRFSSEESEYVALMPFWIFGHHHRYSKKLFENTILLPFEYTVMPVPAEYSEVLKIEYGDYMSVHKGGGGHHYPVYKNQEAILREKNKGNPFRYTMTKTAAQEFHREKTTKEKCLEMTGMLLQAHAGVASALLSGNAEAAAQLLGSCQTLAISLGTYMEERLKGSEHLVHMLEDYCEKVYAASLSREKNSREELDLAIREVETGLDGYFAAKKKEVLFLACKASWWSSLNGLYEKYLAEPDTEVYVLPLSYLEGDRLTGVNGGAKNDSAQLAGYKNLTLTTDYDIVKRHPDVIVTQYPYDKWGQTMDVPEFFYSKNLTAHTDKLVYVPFLDVDPPIDENDKAAAAIRVMIEQPAVLYADQVMVSSDKLKKLYVDTLSDLVGMRDLWDRKVAVTDTIAPEGTDRASERPMPDAWKKKAGERKILIFGVNGAFLLENGSRAVQKLRDSLEQIGAAREKIVCLYAPGKDLEAVKRIDPELWQEYARFEASIREKDYVLYGEEGTAEQLIGQAAGYYGCPGNLAHKCRNRGKPVMLMQIL